MTDADDWAGDQAAAQAAYDDDRIAAYAADQRPFRLAADGIEEIPCDTCGQPHRRYIGAHNRRCDRCCDITCHGCGAVAEDLDQLAADRSECNTCSPIRASA